MHRRLAINKASIALPNGLAEPSAMMQQLLLPTLISITIKYMRCGRSMCVLLSMNDVRCPAQENWNPLHLRTILGNLAPPPASIFLENRHPLAF